MNLKWFIISGLLMFGCSVQQAQHEEALKKLADEFSNPPVSARPCAYWNWLNGDVTLSGITSDLEEAKDKGLGGLQMWDTEAMRNLDGFVPAGPPFLGEESVEAIHHAIKEAERLDLELGLICASGWNSGGSWVTPQMASKNLFHEGIVVSGPGQIRQKLPFPEVPVGCPKGADGLPAWYLDVAVLAWPDSETKIIPDLSAVVNISDKFKDGELVWNAPPGKWQVVRFVCSNNGQQLIAASPNSKGFFIDFLDPEATRFHFEYIFKQLGLNKGDTTQTPLKTLDDDSMELHEGIQWTTGFQKWFEKYHGYNPVNWLPVFLGWEIKNKDLSDRFQYDYKKTVSDLLIYSHYTTGSEVCEEYGVQLVAEAGGPGPPFWESCPVDALKALGNVHIPRGEFWLGNPRNLFLIKEIASASHIYGKKYVDAESWTTWRRWRDGPVELKRLVDRAFCEGLNRVTYHGYSNSPDEFGYPGRTYHAGLDMNPRITWWPKARPFMDYLARCSYMLQQGLYVADVAYYYGDQAPNFWPFYHNVPEKPTIDGLGNGYEYDVVNTDIILNRMAVNDGRIVLPDGMSYRVLVLPDKKELPLEVLRKLEKMVSEGATIIGAKPSEVPGLRDFENEARNLRELADKMWGDCNGSTVKVNKYGKGSVVWGYSPEQWLQKEAVGPDFRCQNTQQDSVFNFIHRETTLAHIYFISNKTQNAVNAECKFRVENSVPQLWDPTDGSVRNQFVYKIETGGIIMPVSLPPGGSVFVVFNKGTKPTGLLSLTKEEVNGTDSLPVQQIVLADKKLTVFECWQNGKYILTGGNRKQKQVIVDNIGTPVKIDGDWNVQFNPEWGAPEKVVFSKLISWTEHENQGIKYYSGKGTYTKTITVQDGWIGDGKNIYLDLGKVGEIAEVFINGKSAGVVWKPPFRTDITKLVKQGSNELKVEVMNLWVNRLTGDAKLPESERLTKTNIHSDGGSWLKNYTEWHVEAAGLFGPVHLLSSHLVEIK
jgi:hypothetical protein